MSDTYIGYVAWCRSKSLRPMSPGEFFNEMTELCAQAGIPVEEEAGCVYLANVQPCAADGNAKGADAGSSPAP